MLHDNSSLDKTRAMSFKYASYAICDQPSSRLACALTQSGQELCYLLIRLQNLAWLYSGHGSLWPDCTVAQAGLKQYWPHMAQDICLQDWGHIWHQTHVHKTHVTYGIRHMFTRHGSHVSIPFAAGQSSVPPCNLDWYCATVLIGYCCEQSH